MRFGILPAILLGTILCTGALAQDGHYWDNQYGTKGELLGGLVVGDPADLSATFYNPGWVALRISPGAILTTKAAEIYTIKIKDGAPANNEFTATTSGRSPGYLAGRFSVDEGTGWKWAYSYLQKVKFNYSTTNVDIFNYDALPPQGATDFSSEFFREQDSLENWFGVTLSRKIGDNLGLGFTPYGVYRSMKSRKQVAAQALDSQQDFGQIYSAERYQFWHGRLLCKIGLAYQAGDLGLGLTYTTPSLGVTGSGSAYTSTTYSGVDLDENGELDPPYLSSDFQEDLNSHWRSPMSLAAGAHWSLGKSGIYLTVEWFDSLADEKVLEPTDFTAQSTGETQTWDLSYSARSLVNYGLGLDHRFNEKISTYGAFRSDYSAIPEDLRGNMQIAVWDLWHFTGGMSFTYKKMDFTAGLEYSHGSENLRRNASFGDDSGNPTTDYVESEVSYRRIKGLIGFNLGFGPTP